MLVVRELMLGAKRFGDLKADLPGISANVLSHRLDELEQVRAGRRHKLPKPAVSLGLRPHRLGPRAGAVLQSFGRWAARDPEHRKDLHFGATSLILSLRTNFDAARAPTAST